MIIYNYLCLFNFVISLLTEHRDASMYEKITCDLPNCDAATNEVTLDITTYHLLALYIIFSVYRTL
jgi:hypothetical protein